MRREGRHGKKLLGRVLLALRLLRGSIIGGVGDKDVCRQSVGGGRDVAPVLQK
jgi:hypothetical protein